jgi:hypothetical protein
MRITKDLALLKQPRESTRLELSQLVGMPLAIVTVPSKGDDKGCLKLEFWAAEWQDLPMNADQVKRILTAAGLTVIEVSEGFRHWQEPQPEMPVCVYVTLRGISDRLPETEAII